MVLKMCKTTKTTDTMTSAERRERLLEDLRSGKKSPKWFSDEFMEKSKRSMENRFKEINYEQS